MGLIRSRFDTAYRALIEKQTLFYNNNESLQGV